MTLVALGRTAIGTRCRHPRPYAHINCNVVDVVTDAPPSPTPA